MKNKINLETILSVLAVTLCITGYVVFWNLFIADIQGEDEFILAIFFTIPLYLLLCTLFMVFLESVCPIKVGYYIIREDKCGDIKFEAYSYRYIGKYIIDKEKLGSYNDRQFAIERMKNHKTELEKEDCKTTYTIEDYKL